MNMPSGNLTFPRKALSHSRLGKAFGKSRSATLGKRRLPSADGHFAILVFKGTEFLPVTSIATVADTFTMIRG